MLYGELLKKARKNRGLSQALLAKTLGVSQQLIAAWESNTRHMSLDHADKAFKALDICVTIGNLRGDPLDTSD